ncbi:methyltransferase domain-containing protein [Actinobaculum massiliense]|nr:methyltransferase domain-containing protein [Actinobaculum massiliense]MDK8319445.1 methyltransferase domain-containing protein [Actinobaculum massiliense]MDK8566588.1 methyltransferase domain-containing protein [Actinobaculum massiliense]
MQCDYFDAGICRSCALMNVPYERQLAAKLERARAVLAPWAPRWLPPASSPESHFRNKAKMVVGGSVQAPTLGILDAEKTGVDLRECGLYDERIAATFPPLSEFITRAKLVPFDVRSGRGELKNILVSVAPSGALMIRFVLRSTESVVRIKKHLPWLRERIPQALVVTANLLPERAALVEGTEEIFLTDAEQLPMQLGPDFELYLRPGSFFQTNTDIARAMYAQARAWCEQSVARRPVAIWDLYCGVGGFALSVAGPGRNVLGVEISEPAIRAAKRAAARAGHAERAESAASGSVRFIAGDAAQAAREESEAPDIVIVNPPRRGLKELAPWLEEHRPPWAIYSSCNIATLATDLEVMKSYEALEARLFDMFPQTEHMETMALLRLRA